MVLDPPSPLLPLPRCSLWVSLFPIQLSPPYRGGTPSLSVGEGTALLWSPATSHHGNDLACGSQWHVGDGVGVITAGPSLCLGASTHSCPGTTKSLLFSLMASYAVNSYFRIFKLVIWYGFLWKVPSVFLLKIPIYFICVYGSVPVCFLVYNCMWPLNACFWLVLNAWVYTFRVSW